MKITIFDLVKTIEECTRFKVEEKKRHNNMQVLFDEEYVQRFTNKNIKYKKNVVRDNFKIFKNLNIKSKLYLEKEKDGIKEYVLKNYNKIIDEIIDEQIAIIPWMNYLYISDICIPYVLNLTKLLENLKFLYDILINIKIVEHLHKNYNWGNGCIPKEILKEIFNYL